MRLCKGLLLVFCLAIASSAFAQTDQGRISGTVRDASNAFVSGAAVSVKNERTGEERRGTTNDQGYFVIGSLKPSTYTIKVEKTGFAAIEYTAMPVAVGQELALDFEFKPAGVPGNGQRRRHRAGARHQLGAHRRQRQRARSAGPAGQRPADVAAAAAGARLAERRRRHVAGHPLLGPRQRAERHQVRRRRRLGDHRRLAGQRERREPDALQAAGEPRERAGVPRRIEQLPGRIRHRHRRSGERHHQVGRQRLPRRVFEYLRNDALDAPQPLRRPPRPRRQRHLARAQVAR